MEDERGGKMPGYTGHIRRSQQYEERPERSGPRSQIPGYRGFIPGVQAENLFGSTYGKVTHQSATGDFVRGLDIPGYHKYQSQTQNQFVNQAEVKQKSTQEILGVQRKPSPKRMIVPVEAINKFWGTEETEQAQLERSTKAFFSSQLDKNNQETGQQQDWNQSMEVFYGQEQVEKPPKQLGEPIPGYTGVSRRVAADNVFGMTYNEARRQADRILEQHKVDGTKILHERATYKPVYEK